MRAGSFLWLVFFTLILGIEGCSKAAPCIPRAVNYRGDGAYRGAQGSYCFVLDLGEVSLTTGRTYSYRIKGLPTSEYCLSILTEPIQLREGTEMDFASKSSLAHVAAEVEIRGDSLLLREAGHFGEPPHWWFAVLAVGRGKEPTEGSYQFDYGPGFQCFRLREEKDYEVTLSIRPEDRPDISSARVYLKGGQWK